MVEKLASQDRAGDRLRALPRRVDMANIALIGAALIGLLFVLVGLMVPLCCARPCPAGVECYPPPWINEAVFFGGIAMVLASVIAFLWRQRR